MRIEQLEYLAAVTQHGSLRQASERLHLSQPALSEALSKLERELGVTLLDRRRSGARISRQGQELLPTMVEVLEAVDRLRAGRRRPRPCRCGCCASAPSTPVRRPCWCPRCTRSASTTRGPVEMVNIRPQEIHEGLVEGGLDLGLVNVLPGDDVPPDLRRCELAARPSGGVLPHRPPVRDLTRWSPTQLRRRAVRGDALGLPHAPLRPPALRRRPCRRRRYSTDGAEMGKLMVADGLGVTILPDYSIDGDPIVRAGLMTHRPLAGDRPGSRSCCCTGG